MTSLHCGPLDILDAMKLSYAGVAKADDIIRRRLPLKAYAKGFPLVLERKESSRNNQTASPGAKNPDFLQAWLQRRSITNV